MIPDFPSFKRLEVGDERDVGGFISAFPPYSDFNFTSLWAWDVRNQVGLSRIGDNLVVRFSDYLSGEPFLSIIGKDRVNLAVDQLLNHAERNNLSRSLQLVPEEVALLADRKNFEVEADEDHFDYILSVKKLMPKKEGEALSSRRKLVARFVATNRIALRQLDLRDTETERVMLSVFSRWEQQRGTDAHEAQQMEKALRRLFLINSRTKLLAFGVFASDRLVGYSVNEVLDHDKYAIGHFQQADLAAFPGAYAYLMQETAPHLLAHRCEYINLEQDLGLPGLRKWKLSYNPSFYLKKYRIARKSR